MMNPVPAESKCERPEPNKNTMCLCANCCKCGKSRDTHETENGRHTPCFVCLIPQPEVGEWEEDIDKIWSRGEVPKWADDVKFGIKNIVRSALSRRDAEWRERTERAVTQVVEAVEDAYKGNLKGEKGETVYLTPLEAARAAADKAKKNL